MSEPALNCVCLFVGTSLDPRYVERLRAMLERHSSRSIELYCLTDRPAAVEQWCIPVDISGLADPRLDMRPTRHKLRLFDPGLLPCSSFLYLDLTLVICKSIGPLVDEVERSESPLALIRDWNHATVNTCVMFVRNPSAFQAVFEDFQRDVRYDCRLPGDQDYLTASAARHGLEERFDYFPDGVIASYKQLRGKFRRTPRDGALALEKAAIVKFHGLPRPHDLLQTSHWLRRMLRSPKHAIAERRRWQRFVRENWR